MTDGAGYQCWPREVTFPASAADPTPPASASAAASNAAGLGAPVKIVAAAGGGFHTVALDWRGVAWVWGCNEGGQVGGWGGEGQVRGKRSEGASSAQGGGGGCFRTPTELRSIHPAAGAGVTAVAAGYRFTAVVLKAAAEEHYPNQEEQARKHKQEGRGERGERGEDEGDREAQEEAGRVEAEAVLEEGGATEVGEEGATERRRHRDLRSATAVGDGNRSSGSGGRVLFLGSFLGAATSDDSERKAHVVRPDEDLLAAANWRYQDIPRISQSEVESGQVPMGLGRKGG